MKKSKAGAQTTDLQTVSPVRIKPAYTDFVIKTFAAHPYLCALFICLIIDPFYLGADANVPPNALYIESLCVLLGAFGFIYYLYRTGRLDRLFSGIISVLSAAIIFYLTKLYSQSANRGAWLLMGGCAAALLIYYFADTRKYRTQLNALMILSMSFMLKFYYVYYTSVYTRQNDVHTFGGDSGHAAYIEYILYNRSLPDIDVREVWQFCHPPLHHFICAVWIEINENVLGVGHDPARESLQTLTLFYSMAIMITAYRILRHFRLSGAALYVPMIIICFHPSFILLSGSINNDVLSVVFMMGAVFCTLRWYASPDFKGLIKIALCIGLGMMTKLYAAIVAVPIAVVFLIVFIKKVRERSGVLRQIGQFAVFGLICAPLGLWFEIRNYLNYKVPIMYVQEMSESSSQYVGDKNFVSRITDFSFYQFDSVFEQWSSNDSYNEFNPLVALLKNSLFGEGINEGTFSNDQTMINICRIFFFLSVLIAAVFFILMIAVLLMKSEGAVRGAEKALLGIFYLAMIIEFYKNSKDYPFTCTMNFRYITPTVIICSLFSGLFLKRIEERKDRNAPETGVCAAAEKVFIAAALSFALLSAVVYIVVCSPSGS